MVPPDPPGDEPSPGRGPRRVVWGVAGGLMIAAIVALALALAANDDDEPQPGACRGRWASDRAGASAPQREASREARRARRGAG